jgi:hypothetical protein
MSIFPSLLRFNLKKNSQNNLYFNKNNLNLNKNLHMRTLSEGSFFENEKNAFITKLLNPEIFKNIKKKNELFSQSPLFKSKIFNRSNQINIEEKFQKYIRTIPNKDNLYSKKETTIKTFDNIITQKTGRKLLQETSQEESNNRVFYAKFYVYELLSAVLSLISLIIIVSYFENTFNYEANDKVYPYSYLLVFQNLLYLVFLMNSYLYKYDEFKLRILNHNIPPNSSFRNSKFFKKFIIEVLFTIIQPCKYFQNIHYTITISYGSGIALKRSINSILSIFILTRIIFIDKFLIFQSSFMTPDNDEICRKHFFKANIKYSLKSLLRTNPFHIYAMTVISLLFAFQFIIKVFESSVNEYIEDAKLNNSFDVIYYCLITMFTVGYGDIAVKTEGGRLFIVILTVIGSFLIALFVMSLTNILNKSPIEIKQYNLLTRINLIEQNQENAKKVAIEFAELISKRQIFDFNEKITDLKHNTRNFINSVKNFQKSQTDLKFHSIQINDYDFDNINIGFQYFDNEYQRMIDADEENIQNLKKILNEIEYKKNILINKKNKIENFIS